MAARDDDIRRSVEAQEKKKRIEQAKKKARKASRHRRGIIGENIGRIQRDES